MRFDDFLAQAHAYPVPWGWCVKMEIRQADGSVWHALWRHTASSTKAEADRYRRDAIAAGWVRKDARLSTVKVFFHLSEASTIQEAAKLEYSRGR